jgi:hypothetical protein
MTPPTHTRTAGAMHTRTRSLDWNSEVSLYKTAIEVRSVHAVRQVCGV